MYFFKAMQDFVGKTDAQFVAVTPRQHTRAAFTNADCCSRQRSINSSWQYKTILTDIQTNQTAGGKGNE